MNSIHYNQLNEAMNCRMSITPENVVPGMMATMYVGSDRYKKIVVAHPTKNTIIVSGMMRKFTDQLQYMMAWSLQTLQISRNVTNFITNVVRLETRSTEQLRRNLQRLHALLVQRFLGDETTVGCLRVQECGRLEQFM